MLTRIEIPYPVASTLLMDQCGQFGATEKVLWIAFIIVPTGIPAEMQRLVKYLPPRT